MTSDEQAEIKREAGRIDDRIAYWTAQHRRAVERREQEACARARAPEYARAKAAADRWRRAVSHAYYSGDLDRLQRHVVDLAAEEPTITIRWLAPGARSTELVGYNHAQAHLRERVVVCTPVCDLPSYVVTLHEIGHIRDPAGGTLLSEVFAWRWARSHSLVWNDVTQKRMVACLGSYVKAAKEGDVLGVLEAERFMSGFEYRQERQRRLEMELSRR